MMAVKIDLIKLLADGKFHSGRDLGDKLQLSRSGIWKIIQQLAALGITVNSLKGRGYQIPNGLELLDSARIKSLLPEPIIKKANLEILQEINSTNDYLFNRHRSRPSGSVVIAEHQTNGRGRRQREWLSPYGQHLYFSILWCFEKDPSELGGLSLASGVAVVNTLERYGLSCLQLKWPNDILFDYQKLAGVLIEMTAETHSSTQVVIGIGINITKMLDKTSINQPCTDIATISSQKPSRNIIAAYLIEEMFETLSRFQKKGVQDFFKHWQALDAYYGKPVEVMTPQRTYKGTGRGINQKGEYIIVDNTDNEMRFSHGEVSLRSS